MFAAIARSAYLTRLRERSERLPPALFRLTTALCIAWAGLFLMLAAFRVLASPVSPEKFADCLPILLPYLAIAVAPLAGYLLATAGFPRSFQPATLTLFPSLGVWRKLDPCEAQRHPLFGPAGFMASLLVGLLLNVVMRGVEFLMAVPAISAGGPDWAQALFLLAAGDVAVMSFVYMICFAMALRSIPLFPRLLAFAWLLDVFLQLFIAHSLGTIGDLPTAVGKPLGVVLFGNIQKVLISAFVWLPYLLLSDRANVTFRHRVSRD